eukprot:ANDGO_05352.mRNA.1 hypothetical protein
MQFHQKFAKFRTRFAKDPLFIKNVSQAVLSSAVGKTLQVLYLMKTKVSGARSSPFDKVLQDVQAAYPVRQLDKPDFESCKFEQLSDSIRVLEHRLSRFYDFLSSSDPALFDPKPFDLRSVFPTSQISVEGSLQAMPSHPDLSALATAISDALFQLTSSCRIALSRYEDVAKDSMHVFGVKLANSLTRMQSCLREMASSSRLLNALISKSSSLLLFADVESLVSDFRSAQVSFTVHTIALEKESLRQKWLMNVEEISSWAEVISAARECLNVSTQSFAKFAGSSCKKQETAISKFTVMLTVDLITYSQAVLALISRFLKPRLDNISRRISELNDDAEVWDASTYDMSKKNIERLVETNGIDIQARCEFITSSLLLLLCVFSPFYSTVEKLEGWARITTNVDDIGSASTGRTRDHQSKLVGLLQSFYSELNILLDAFQKKVSCESISVADETAELGDVRGAARNTVIVPSPFSSPSIEIPTRLFTILEDVFADAEVSQAQFESICKETFSRVASHISAIRANLFSQTSS